MIEVSEVLEAMFIFQGSSYSWVILNYKVSSCVEDALGLLFEAVRQVLNKRWSALSRMLSTILCCTSRFAHDSTVWVSTWNSALNREPFVCFNKKKVKALYCLPYSTRKDPATSRKNFTFSITSGHEQPVFFFIIFKRRNRRHPFSIISLYLNMSMCFDK